MDVVFGGMFILGFLNFARGNLEAFPLQILVLTGPWKARKLVYIYIYVILLLTFGRKYFCKRLAAKDIQSDFALDVI